MSTNKLIIYSFILIFTIALYATFPKNIKYYPPEVRINFKKKHFEKVSRAERDPFRYKTKKESSSQKQWKPSSITIKGIIWDNETPSAAISINNGKTIFVNEGEKIGKIKILKIERDKIIIDEYGRRTISFK
jgi:type II secretory pathway component PulC